jgi:peptide/nickel transport system permease protein
MAAQGSAAAPAAPVASRKRAPRGGVARAIRGALRSRRGKTSAAIIAFVTAVAFIGPLIPYVSPLAFVAPPFSPPPDGGPLGSDNLGRDVLARVLNGGWRLLLMAGAATILAMVSGAAAGIVAAYFRGRSESVIMRTVDVLLAIPALIFVLMMLSVVGPETGLVIFVVAFIQAPQVTRIAFAAAQDVCERDFVKAIAILGVPAHRVIRRQILPMLMTPLMVEAGLRLTWSIVLIAGLSFLGLGTPPPDPDWGVMISENRLGLGSNVWGVLAPAILIALLSVGTNSFADAIARAGFGEDRGEDLMLAAEASTAGSDVWVPDGASDALVAPEGGATEGAS